MKLLNSSDLTNLNVKFAVKRDSTPCVKELVEIAKVMDVKQGVLVNKSEWTIKTPPNVNSRKPLAGKKFSVGTLADNSGWVITRTA